MKIMETETSIIIDLEKDERRYGEQEIKNFMKGVSQVRARLIAGKRTDVLRWVFSKNVFSDRASVARFVSYCASEVRRYMELGVFNNQVRWMAELVGAFIGDRNAWSREA